MRRARGHQLLACLATQASWASPAPLHVAAFATWIPTRPPFRHLPPTPSCRSTNHLRKESLRLYSSQSGGGGGGGGTHTLQRLYVAVPLTPSCALELSDEQSHYLRNVLRCRDGTQLRLFNGRDGEYLASVEADVDGGGSGGGGRGGKRARASGPVRLRVAAGPPLRRQPGSAEEARDGSAADAGDGGGGSGGGAALQASLFFAAIKPKPMKLVVEKATELGVCGLQPLISDRAQVKKGDVEKQLGKLGAVALEAAEQSERLTVPPIFPPQTLKVAVQQWLGDAGDDGAERVVVVCEERSVATVPLLSCLQALRTPASTASVEIALVVGPEGGWAPGEVDALAEPGEGEGGAGGDEDRGPMGSAGAKRRIWRVSLGENILRAETAAMYVLAACGAVEAAASGS